MDLSKKIRRVMLTGCSLLMLLAINAFSQTSLATFNFESSNLSPSAGAIGSPVLTASATVSFFGGSTTSSTASACFASANTKYFELTISTLGYNNITVDWNGRTSSTTSSWVVTANDGSGYGTTLLTHNLTTSFAAASTLNLASSFNNNASIKVRWTANVSSTQTVRIDDIVIKGTAVIIPPTITVSPTSLTGLSYMFGSGPSAEQTFTCSGASLTNDISLSAPTNYEISTTSGSGFTSALTLTQVSGSVASTTIYVRLKSGLAAGTYNGEIIDITSTGATSRTVTCSGTVTIIVTGVFINEILVNPADANDGSNAPNTSEWVELYNSTGASVDISCWFITDGDFAVTFPAGSSIAAGGYFTIASASGSGLNPDLDWALCGCTSGAASEVGIFTNSAEQVVLYDASGNLMDAIIWGGGQLPDGITRGATGTCSAVTVTFPASGSFESIGTISDGIPNERDTDGSSTWQPTATGTFAASNGTVVLPIELLSFTGKYNGINANDLYWSTASETNNDYFTVERSADGIEFSKISDVNGAGNSTSTLHYSTEDKQPLTGINYYRLKQTDFDGNFSYSQIVPLTFNNGLNANVYPNPANDLLNIQISGFGSETICFEIITLLGVVITQEKQVKNDDSLFTLNIGELSAGTYILRTFTDTETKQTLFIKK